MNALTVRCTSVRAQKWGFSKDAGAGGIALGLESSCVVGKEKDHGVSF